MLFFFLINKKVFLFCSFVKFKKYLSIKWIIKLIIIFFLLFLYWSNNIIILVIIFVLSVSLFFKYNSQFYKIPTYGKIFKIIDFGRSIYKYKGHLFCSDSFAPGGDASTQYNFKPYYNSEKPNIEPNYSFDLCRLGCSIYDFIIEITKTD